MTEWLYYTAATQTRQSLYPENLSRLSVTQPNIAHARTLMRLLHVEWRGCGDMPAAQIGTRTFHGRTHISAVSSLLGSTEILDVLGYCLEMV